MKYTSDTKHFAAYIVRLKEGIARDLPLLAGNCAVRLFKRNFQDEGFFSKKWTPSKRIGHSKGAANSRPTLTGPTGNLGRSLRFFAGNASVVVYSDLPYSAAHNEGTRNAGRGRRTVIPQRQFMGNSKELEEEIKHVIYNYLKNIKP